MYKFLGIAFCSFMIISGVVFVYGALKKWSILVDPPIDLWNVDDAALIKKVLGKKFLLFFTYFLGILFICGGIYGLWNGLKNQSNKTETGDTLQQEQLDTKREIRDK